MCGNHDHDGSPIGHRHHAAGSVDPEQPGLPSGRSIFRPRSRTPIAARSRRAFLGDFGKGAVALAVFTPLVAACSSDDSAAPSATDGSSTTASTDSGSDSQPAGQTDSGSETTESGTEPSDPPDESADGLRWARANLGFVSAYVLARGTTAAIVDTGGAGSANAIGETLQSLGLSYSDVDHLILTHRHGDHVGSIGEVMAQASSATVYAGEADLDEISADGIVPLVGGEDVFGLLAIATPGHTPGHMAVIDETTGLLVAGDALFTEDGGVVEGPERFFDDVPESRQTIRDLAALSFNTLLVGHGDPIEANADTAVADLAASLP